MTPLLGVAGTLIRADEPTTMFWLVALFTAVLTSDTTTDLKVYLSVSYTHLTLPTKRIV